MTLRLEEMGASFVVETKANVAIDKRLFCTSHVRSEAGKGTGTIVEQMLRRMRLSLNCIFLSYPEQQRGREREDSPSSEASWIKLSSTWHGPRHTVGHKLERSLSIATRRLTQAGPGEGEEAPRIWFAEYTHAPQLLQQITNRYRIFVHPTICADGSHIAWFGTIESSIIGEQKSPVSETTSSGQDHRSKLTSMVHCVTCARFLMVLWI
ncbi:hypothetical protein V8E53_003846 [Lactarius tabidus]